MTKPDKQSSVGKGAIYLYVDTFASMISGYAFWIIVSKIATANTIGTSSAVVSFAGIVSVVCSIGIPYSIQRFLGKSFSEHKLEDAKLFVRTSLLLVSIGILICCAGILIVKDWISSIFNLDFNLLLLSILLIGSSALALLFRSIIIASLETRTLPTITIVSSVARIILTIFLILLGTGAWGLTLGYTFSQVVISVLSGYVIFMIFKSSIGQRNKMNLSFYFTSKKILVASTAFWIPFLVTTIGSQLGTVVVFGSQGSNQAALYFMALTIVTGILGVMYSLFTIALPALSAMEDGRKRFAWQTIRLSMIIAIPFSSSIIFYSKEILQLLGPVYIEATLPLEILLLSVFPTSVLSGINDLVHAYGNYRQVLIIGITTSIPRTLLYFVLVPLYGSTGAAIAYTIGSIVGFIASVIIAKKLGMNILWKILFFILIIPMGIAFVLDHLHVSYIVGIPATLIISYGLLLKLRILTKYDVKYLLGILPYRISYTLSRIFDKITRKLNRAY